MTLLTQATTFTRVGGHTMTPTKVLKERATVTVAAQTTVTVVTGASTMAGPVTLALAAVGLAERCLLPVQDELNRPLSFPNSAIPSLRFGPESSMVPRLPYYRGAALASLAVHAAVWAVTGAIAAVMYLAGLTKRKRWYSEALLRGPLLFSLSVDGLLLDGGIAGGATAVSVGGVSEVGYLIAGLIGPVVSVVVTLVFTLKRVEVYDPNWLLHGASAATKQQQDRPLGAIHRYVVGLGLWHGPLKWQLMQPAYGTFRGPSEQHGDDDNDYSNSSNNGKKLIDRVATLVSQLSPYYSVLITVPTMFVSGVRGMQGCLLPSIIAGTFCTIVALLTLLLRPMTSVVKNIIAIILTLYTATNIWLIVVGAWNDSPDLLRTGLTMALWGAYLTVIHLVFIAVCYLLSALMAPETKNGVEVEEDAVDHGNDAKGDTYAVDAPSLMDEDDIIHLGGADDDDQHDSGTDGKTSNITNNFINNNSFIQTDTPSMLNASVREGEESSKLSNTQLRLGLSGAAGGSFKRTCWMASEDGDTQSTGDINLMVLTPVQSFANAPAAVLEPEVFRLTASAMGGK